MFVWAFLACNCLWRFRYNEVSHSWDKNYKISQFHNHAQYLNVNILAGHWTVKLDIYIGRLLHKPKWRQLCEYENQTLEALVASSSLTIKFDYPVERQNFPRLATAQHRNNREIIKSERWKLACPRNALSCHNCDVLWLGMTGIGPLWNTLIFHANSRLLSKYCSKPGAKKKILCLSNESYFGPHL